jgi:hypothetical protein
MHGATLVARGAVQRGRWADLSRTRAQPGTSVSRSLAAAGERDDSEDT